MTRLYVGQGSAVRGGRRRRQPTSDEAAQTIAQGWAYLDEHRGRPHYRHLRRGGYVVGRGCMASSNKFMCPVRLKRSGAWWYEVKSNKMLALRWAQDNGTLDPVFLRYHQRLRETSE